MRLDRLIKSAMDLHRAGRYDLAIRVYDKVLRTDPRHLDVLHLRGVAAYQIGDDEQATAFLKQAIAVDGLRAPPHHYLGLVRARQGRLDAAAASLQTALALDPESAAAHHDLGVLWFRQNKMPEAEKCFRRALMIAPTMPKAWLHLALARRLAEDLDEALDCYRQAIAIEPAYVDAYVGLGETLRLLGQSTESVQQLRQALSYAPADARLLCELGESLSVLGELDSAIDSFRQSLALNPACFISWLKLGCAQSANGELVAAAESLSRAVELAPDDGDAQEELGHVLFESGRIEQALDAWRAAAVRSSHRSRVLGTIASMLPGSPRADTLKIRLAREAWWDSTDSGDSARSTRTRFKPRLGRRLRVGYLSAFFQHRNWMKSVFGLINHHNREQLDIHLFSDAPETSLPGAYRRHPRDRVHDISGLSSRAAASLIKHEEIDILIDLNGYSKIERLDVVGFRPAAVNVAWFNMYAPSGINCFDYLVGDEQVIPPCDDALYHEQIIRTPGCYLTFEVGYPVPEVASTPCLSQGYFTFGCLAPQYKITTDTIEVWSRILFAVSGSRLILKNWFLDHPEHRSFVHELFARFGIASERIELDGGAEHFEFLKKYDHIDLSLDTFPYNGGTTTIEALWQGVPVLTFYGDRWASRISASLLRNAGLPELVAGDLDDYVARAIHLASSADAMLKLDHLRRSMRQRLRAAPVCDTRAFARSMERAYLAMLVLDGGEACASTTSRVSLCADQCMAEMP